jgi:uncharacterized protein (TIGR02453 family)
LKFLGQLQRNNNRDWFNKNKSRYEEEVLAPSLSYIEAMRQPLEQFSPLLDCVPKRVGGSLMRIYRDTRFAKDKTPYKTNIGIHFRHQAGCDVHAPGLYVHIEPKEVFLGVGMWHPDTQPLANVRQRIADSPAKWKRVRDGKAFRGHFELTGESLKRPPRGFDPEHEMLEDLKRKDFIGVCRLDPDVIVSPDFVKETTKLFKTTKPFFRFLCEALGVPL